VKSAEELMEILEAFDLVGSSRGAAALVGCDHKAVARCVALRDAALGELRLPRPRPRVDPFAEKIGEWVERSRGRVRADVAHQRLVAMGYQGSERTTRRAEAGLAAGERATDAALGSGAGVVDAVGLRRGAAGRRAADVAVVRLAGVEPFPGGGAPGGPGASERRAWPDRSLRSFEGAPAKR